MIMQTGISQNIPLADKTSYKIGGGAAFYVEPSDDDGVAAAYKFARDNGLDTFVLGNGSNLLISDKGVDALVINLSRRLSSILWDDGRDDMRGNIRVRVSAGYSLNDFTHDAARRGCAGVVGLSGIPATVGGAVTMNAGAFDMEISDALRSVKILRADTLLVETVTAADLNFGYRTSAVKGTDDVVLSATFEFALDDPQKLLSERENILAKRREKQPLEFPSCGSVFKRPPNNFAGTLIESCGLKGFRIGGAAVSEKHANFIINIDNAKAEDVRGVIAHVQKKVYENSGVTLAPEVIFWGEFETPLFEASLRA